MGFEGKALGRGCTIMGVPFTALTFAVSTEFKQRPFWATLVNKKWTFFFLICLGTTRFVLLSAFFSWHTYTNPRPAQFQTHAQSHITRALAHSNLDPRALLRKPESTGVENVADTCLSTQGRPYLNRDLKIWNISKSTAANQSAWYSRLANEPRTLAPWIGSIQSVNKRESWNGKLILTARRWRSKPTE